MKRLSTLSLLLVLGLSLTACSPATVTTTGGSVPSSGQTSTPASGSLQISAAASLSDAMEELKPLFLAKHSGSDISFNFGSSGALQQQIEQGAPVDVFVSAGQKQMTALSDAGLMDPSTVKPLLKNEVVLIAPWSAASLKEFKDLGQDSVKKIGIGDPDSVPAGQYAREVLVNLQLFEPLTPKFVFAKDVREVLAWVETEAVDYGIVYETDAKISSKVQIVLKAPEGSHKAIVYPAGAVKASKQPDLAKAFVDFLFTDEAKAVFVKYGFTPQY